MNNVMELLPIGSVVRLMGAKKSLMIIGVCQTNVDNQSTYDYLGVLWPEGNMGAQSQVLFNHADVEWVEFYGLNTKERKDFLVRLNEFYQSQQ